MSGCWVEPAQLLCNVQLARFNEHHIYSIAVLKHILSESEPRNMSKRMRFVVGIDWPNKVGLSKGETCSVLLSALCALPSHH